MRIITYSDLHLEFGSGWMLPSAANGDVMILAGDIVTLMDYAPLDRKRSTNAPVPRAESMLRRRDEQSYLPCAFPRKHFVYVTGPQNPLFDYLTPASPNESTACHIAGGSVCWRSEPNASARDGCQSIAEYFGTARRKPYDHCAGTTVAHEQRQFTVGGYTAEVLALSSALPT